MTNSKRCAMTDDTMWSQFKREEHVYQNDQFDEILKDAVRFFNGRGVYPLPPAVSFYGIGVYAIYCTARDGLYRKFGETVNRLEYAVPIYVGKTVSFSCCEKAKNTNGLFVGKNVGEQLQFWANLIACSIGLKGQFNFRACILDQRDAKLVNAMHRWFLRQFHPVWNKFFASCTSQVELERKWRLAHSIRFKSRADVAMQGVLAEMLKVV